jgi:hypothetical protein
MARIYIDKYVGTLARTDLYLVKLTMKDGTVYEDLEPRRLFPFTNPNMYITLLNKDEREVGFVRDLSELDEPSVKALEACFAEYYLIAYFNIVDFDIIAVFILNSANIPT